MRLWNSRDEAKLVSEPSPPSPAERAANKLHTLGNSLASLRLRLGVVLAENPQWAEDPNFIAMARILDDASEEARGLRSCLAGLDTPPPVRKTRRRV